jgi:quercetin dioxygenase-like cupin family protein
MKHLVGMAAILGFAVCAVTVNAEDPARARLVDKGPEHHLTYRPQDIEWRDGPASFEAGAQYAMLEGDMSEPGVFTLRIKLPDGFEIAPHWHPNVERVTVLSGTFHLGAGETMDKQNADRLESGSYTSMPPGMRHFAFVEGETEIQLTTVGPWEIHYINPDDDPRLRQTARAEKDKEPAAAERG